MQGKFMAVVEEVSRGWGPGVRYIRQTPGNTLASEAYELVRADIISGRLAPGGKLLTESIKERYGIGGSPMREALTRLAADGLLTNEGQKGFRVVTASVGELADIGRVRMQLELNALTLAIEIGGVEWEVSVVSRFHRLQHALQSYRQNPDSYGDEWESSHRAFHFALLSGCDSPWMMHFCDRIYDQTERYRRLFTRYDRIPSKLNDSHKQIFDAAIARDLDTCLLLTRQHIAFATRQTLADMLTAGAAPDAKAELSIEQLGDTPLRRLLVP
jgi:GntR family carbon starvation induced transcriptional regulator